MTLDDMGLPVMGETVVRDAWGNKYAGGTTERYGYAQREHDPESGLVHMRARMYEPRLGRFTQTDPVLASRATEQYLYGFNNPVSMTDPMGTYPDIGEYVRKAMNLADYAVGQSRIASSRQSEIKFIDRRAAELGSSFLYNATVGWWGAEEMGRYNARRIELKGKTALFNKTMAGDAGFWMHTITAASPQGVGSRVLCGKDYITNEKVEAVDRVYEGAMALLPFGLGRLSRGVGAPIRGAMNAADLEVAAVVAQTESRMATLARTSSAPVTGYTWNQVFAARYGAANVEWMVPELPDKPLTLGVLRTPKGNFDLSSGWSGPAASMPKGSSGFDIVTRTHVEGHAAAFMQKQGIQEGTLYINNPVICPSCDRNLPYMLGPGRTMQVVPRSGLGIPFLGAER
jgi:RHS repeat-associated protein